MLGKSDNLGLTLYSWGFYNTHFGVFLVGESGWPVLFDYKSQAEESIYMTEEVWKGLEVRQYFVEQEEEV